MSDEELIARLRKQSNSGRANHVSKADRLAAADRIEVLIAERDREKAYAFQCAMHLDAALEQLNAAEAKLSGAVAECERIGRLWHEAEAKLAKVEALMDVGFAEYERRMAKAVDALEKIAGVNGPYSHPFPEASEGYGAFAIVTSREALAEIKGESHE